MSTSLAARMRLLTMAYRLERANGTDAVLAAYDKLQERILRGEPATDADAPFAPLDSLVAEFLASNCEEKPGARVQVGVVYAAFRQWCASAKGMPAHAIMSLRAFGDATRSSIARQYSNKTYLLGIRLLQPSAPAA